MPISAFIKSFNIKNYSKKSKIEYFDSIIITPESVEAKSVSITLLDTKKTNSAFIYKINQFAHYEKLITIFDREVKSPKYFSSYLKGFTKFNKNIFIPIFETGAVYNELVWANPYYINNDDSPTLNNIRNEISVFFDGVAPKYPDTKKVNEYTFSNKNIVVNYIHNGVIEYFNYKNASSKDLVNFDSAYASALNFIAMDTSIKNKYFLSKYENVGKDWFFYFNIAVNDFPVFISPQLTKTINMQYPIEVKVNNNLVVEYKHFINFYYISDEEVNVNLDFNLPLEASGYEDNIEKLSLSYNVDSMSSHKLYWVLEVLGAKPFLYPAKD